MSESFNATRRRSSVTPAPWDKSILSPKTGRDNGRSQRLIKGKFLCLVTGAGNGLGRAIAGIAFQDQGILPTAMAGSRVILIDIDEDALKETSGKKMRQFLKHRKIEVELEVVDLSDLNEIKHLVRRIEERCDKDYEHVIFVNNAITVIDPTKTLEDLDDTESLGTYWNLNITSRIFLSAQICRIFEQSKRTVIHTGRMDSATPTKYMGPSCMATSAIETFAKTFAQENPKIRLLHFQVGFLDTKRTKRLIESTGNKELQELLQRLEKDGKLENPIDAAKRIIRYIEGDDYVPGEVLTVEDNVD